ncbi:MAG TPA: NUDIX domain-containing protein [Pyrinomonadaceae bacterium]|nr:NUDIX domain-containing protein [Pyrinomonadaceae bacterium]
MKVKNILYAYLKLLGVVLVLLGFVGVLLTRLLLSEPKWAVDLFTSVSIALLTVGISSLITKFNVEQYIRPDKNFSEGGIQNCFTGRVQLKESFDGYTNLIRGARQLVFVGIKHADLVGQLYDLVDEIEERSERFKLEIFFLDPNSDSRLLFERDVYAQKKHDLATTIDENLMRAQQWLASHPELNSKVLLWKYDCVPMANIIAVDDRRFYFNHYHFFQPSVTSLWFEATDRGYGAKLQQYLQHVRRHAEAVQNAAETADLLPAPETTRSSIRQFSAQPGDAELIDVIDDLGRPTGMVKTRSQIHRDGDIHRAVHVWFVNSRGEVLFQKRSGDTELEPGKWDISCAGHVRSGQTSVDSAISEVFEELGVRIDANDLTFVFAYPQTFNPPGLFIRQLVDVYLVHSDVRVADLKMPTSEVSGVRYYPVDKLGELADSVDPEFAKNPFEFRQLHHVLSDRNDFRPNADQR